MVTNNRLNQLYEFKKEIEYEIQCVQDKIKELDENDTGLHFGDEVMERAALFNYLSCLDMKLEDVKKAIKPLATSYSVSQVRRSWR